MLFLVEKLNNPKGQVERKKKNFWQNKYFCEMLVEKNLIAYFWGDEFDEKQTMAVDSQNMLNY